MRGLHCFEITVTFKWYRVPLPPENIITLFVKTTLPMIKLITTNPIRVILINRVVVLLKLWAVKKKMFYIHQI